MQRTTSNKARLIVVTATAIIALSAAVAFAAPVLQPGTTLPPHGPRGTCTGCHTYANPPVVTPPVVTQPVVVPPVVTTPTVPPVFTTPTVTPTYTEGDSDSDREHGDDINEAAHDGDREGHRYGDRKDRKHNKHNKHFEKRQRSRD